VLIHQFYNLTTHNRNGPAGRNPVSIIIETVQVGAHSSLQPVRGILSRSGWNRRYHKKELHPSVAAYMPQARKPNRPSSARHHSDEFSFDLTLRHASFDPSDISGSLCMQPSFSLKARERASRLSLWQSVVAASQKDTDFSEALRTTASVLTRHRKFLNEFKNSGGEIHITLNHFVEVSTAVDFKDGEEDKTRSDFLSSTCTLSLWRS
jgi:hypothetical protein